MNFAFVIVVIAAVTGITLETALRAIAPHAGPALALSIMAMALFAGATRLGRKRSAQPSAVSRQLKLTADS